MPPQEKPEFDEFGYPRRWPRHSVEITCKHCEHRAQTKCKLKNGGAVYVIFGVMAITGLWLCSPIACCMTILKDAEHSCENCGKVVGFQSGF